MQHDPEYRDRIEKMSYHLHRIRAQKPCGCNLSHCFECYARISIDRENRYREAGNVMPMRAGRNG